MKKLLIVSACIFLCLCSLAQDKDVSALSIRVVQPEREYLKASSCRLLQTKLTQILTQNGIAKDLPSNRFVFTAKANVVSKDVIAGSPSRVSELIELTFLIGDVVDNIQYGTHVVTLRGIGQNEEQALIQAIKGIRVKDPAMDQFITESKTKIVNYYRDNEEKILREADLLASEGRYDEAVYGLSMIPDACGACFDRCQDKILEIRRTKRDVEGESLLSRARAAWAKSPNAEGAEEVYPLVSAISPSASCYPEVKPFLNQISKKLMADEKRAWDFKVKQYEDERAREQRDFEARIAREQRDFDAQQAREIRNAEIRRQEIEAARQAAVEYARNQPDVVYYSYNQTVLLW